MKYTCRMVLAALILAGACSGKSPSSGDKSAEEVAVGWNQGKDTRQSHADPDVTVDPEPDIDGADSSSDLPALPPDSTGGPDVTEPGPDIQVPTPDVDNPAECVDKDGDGYGPGCYLGKDCDDANPHFNIYCPPCDTQSQEGCKCAPEGTVEICFEGDPGSVGIGECQLGQRQCKGGFWSACIGQIVPAPEECDHLDNDCDGSTDEGVLSPCGDCDPFCDTIKVGPGGIEEFEPTQDNSEKISTNLDGYLVLDSQKVDLAFMWVSNSSENTVSKLDTEECKETGRYAICSNPSRTAVDLLGNVWVGCRSDGGVAKIAIDEALCIDKNGNSQIDTAKDTNNDGKVTGSEIMQPKGSDECILFITYPGGSCQRGLGVDKENYAWVGEYSSKMIRRLHPDDGHVVKEHQITANPYGLIIDQKGTIWVSGRGGSKLVEIDPEQGQVGSYSSNIGCFQPYGIGLDYKGRVWIANCCCDNVAYRFDPESKSWAKAPTHSRPRGIAGSQDGRVYVANDSAGEVAVVDADTMQTLGYIGVGSGKYPIGMTVDFDGYVWTANQSGASATKMDPDNLTVQCEVPVGSGPYTYSDMTGYALHSFTAPQGVYTHVFGGWEGFRVKWTAVHVDADFQDSEDCYVKVRVRTGYDEDELAAKPWQGYYGPFPPEQFPLQLSNVPDMDGPLLQVEVTLFSESKTCTPMIKSIEAKFASE